MCRKHCKSHFPKKQVQFKLNFQHCTHDLLQNTKCLCTLSVNPLKKVCPYMFLSPCTFFQMYNVHKAQQSLKYGYKNISNKCSSENRLSKNSVLNENKSKGGYQNYINSISVFSVEHIKPVIRIYIFEQMLQLHVN